jgi:hypothetical protein
MLEGHLLVHDDRSLIKTTAKDTKLSVQRTVL